METEVPIEIHRAANGYIAIPLYSNLPNYLVASREEHRLMEKWHVFPTLPELFAWLQDSHFVKPTISKV